MSDLQLIQEYQETILRHIFDKIGQKKVRAIILTGSLARNQGVFKTINGQTFLASDIDAILVVRSIDLLTSLKEVKKLSRVITQSLRGLRFLSQVSLSVITEKSLANAIPSIFMYDLVNNGRIIYKNVANLDLPKFLIKEIPRYDIYRLLFNRMVEALDSLVMNSIGTRFDERKNAMLLKSLEKLHLSILQSQLHKQGVLILNSSELLSIGNEKNMLAGHDESVRDNLEYLRIIQKNMRENIFHKSELEKLWIDTVKSFKSVVESEGFSNASKHDFDKLFPSEGMLNKLAKSLLIFVQYYKINSIRDLIRSILFIARSGSDHIYFVMYSLFISSPQLLAYGNTETFNESWLRAFNSNLQIWKHRTGA